MMQNPLPKAKLGGLQPVLEVIRNTEFAVHKIKERRPLLYIYVEDFGIGDCVLYFSRIKAISTFLNNTDFDVATNAQHYNFLQYHPLVNRFYMELDEVDFIDYDLVLTFSNCEFYLAHFLHKRYGRRILEGEMKLSVYSLFHAEDHVTSIFNNLSALEEFIRDTCKTRLSSLKHELYISEAEQAASDEWFESNGIGLPGNEHVIVLLDSTSDRNKLMKIECFEQLLRHFIAWKNCTIVIFNPENFDKRDIYRELVGEEMMSRILFVYEKDLRRNFCLCASKYIRLIIGPCTGLLHCAEGIYNTLELQGRLSAERSILLAYVGPPAPGDHTDKWFWWGNTNVHCCYIDKTENGNKVVRRLTTTGNPGLACKEFETGALLKYLYDNFHSEFVKWNLLERESTAPFRQKQLLPS